MERGRNDNMNELTEQELVRRNKMEDIRSKGIDPFGQILLHTSDLHDF